ncbi:MAG: hypothetical protein K8L99_31460, partial [Anaerolineae bacterium]|nr:hypothetical protein [Anaerolineae bacterium]
MQLLFQLLFFAAIAFIAGMCVFTVWYTNRHPLRPFARYLLLILIAMEIVLAVLHMLQFYNTNMPGFWRWFFDLQYELNLGTIFSTVQLALIAGVALIIFFGLPEAKWWQRLYWLLLAAVFFYLMADEFYSFHETLLSRNPTEAWRVPYAIAGAILFGISALVFWFGYRKELPFFILLFAGLGVMTVSGIGIEEFVLRGFVAYDQRAEWMYIFEEIFEMVGATIVLANMLSFTQRHVTVEFWSRAWRFETVVGIISALWFTLSVLFAPAIEERLFATPVNIDYDNGLMTLVGYRMDTDKAVPGGDIPLTLYWRANKPLPEDYSLSVHLLRHNTTESIAQSDDLHAGPIPARAWFPGVVMRRTVYVPVPRSAPTPSTYDLMVRVWSGPWPFFTPWEDTVGLSVTQSESRPLFAYDAVVLDQVVAAPTDEIQAPETVADYEFPAEGFSIEGYELPQEPVGRTVPVKFWWGTGDKTVNTDLTQFFHLQNADGELLTFDQQPFEGSFPTSDWPAEMQAEDEWTVT